MNSKAPFVAVLVITLGSVGCNSRPNITGPTGLAIASVSPTSAPSFQQTTVSVVGTGFQSGALVRFGDQVATVLALSNSSLTVLTPANVQGVVDVVVTNRNGDEARMTRGFTFYALGASSVSPAAALPMDWVTVVGAGFQLGARVTVAGIDAAIRSVTSSGVNIIVPFCPPGVADVVVTNPNGQSVTLAGGFTCQTILLTPSALSVSPGGSFSVSWASPRDLDMDDWVPDQIRLCRVGESCSSPVWDTTPKGINGTAALNAPMTPGDYEFRYLVDGVQELSKSPPVSVR